MRLVVISGRSGSGKSTALHQLEDEGFYCIDNLPAALLPALVEQTSQNPGEFPGIAVCIDARNTWKDLHRFPELLASLPGDTRVDILYLDPGLDDIVPVTELTSRCYGTPVVSDLAPLTGTAVLTGSTVVVSGRVSPVAATRATAGVTVGPYPASLDAAVAEAARTE